jgi:hypothetical protein
MRPRGTGHVYEKHGAWYGRWRSEAGARLNRRTTRRVRMRSRWSMRHSRWRPRRHWWSTAMIDSGACRVCRAMRESHFEALRDALQGPRQGGSAVERIDELSLRDVRAHHAVALGSRDFELDIAPEDLGHRAVSDGPTKLAPGRIIHVNARNARCRAPGRRVFMIVGATARSTSHRCHVARRPGVPTCVTRRRVTGGASVCVVVAVDGVRSRCAVSGAAGVPPMRFVGSGADG